MPIYYSCALAGIAEVHAGKPMIREVKSSAGPDFSIPLCMACMYLLRALAIKAEEEAQIIKR
jgi:hypothetical protein